MTSTQRVRWSEQIDIRDWDFFDGKEPPRGLRKVMPLAAAVVSQRLRQVLTHSQPDLWLPVTVGGTEDGLGGPPPPDPLTMYLGLPLGPYADGGDNCEWSITLEAVIDTLIDDHVNSEGHKIDDAEGLEICAKISARLRELAEKLDNACAR